MVVANPAPSTCRKEDVDHRAWEMRVIDERVPEPVNANKYVTARGGIVAAAVSCRDFNKPDPQLLMGALLWSDPA